MAYTKAVRSKNEKQDEGKGKQKVRKQFKYLI